MSSPILAPRLTEGDPSDTLQRMTTISIKELHGRTGHWLRRVSEEREVIVTERGRPIARLLPAIEPAKTNPFLRRRLMPGVARLIERPMDGSGSTEIISEGRDGR
jgi:prevent-host-death family protein